MTSRIQLRAFLASVLVLSVGACGGGGFGSGNLFGGGSGATAQAPQVAEERQSTIWDLFTNKNDPNTTVEVNKYLWQASLEVLNFLPWQQVDPFSGVMVSGFGTPPGGGGAYRATVYVQDPSLDARSLKVALVSRAGPVAPDTVRAVEDAILTRARQLRIRDSKL
jgi:hypothetical protein